MNPLRDFHSDDKQVIQESVLSVLNERPFEEHIFTLIENYIYEYIQEYHNPDEWRPDNEEEKELMTLWNEYLSDDDETDEAKDEAKDQAVNVKCQYTTRFHLKHGTYTEFYTNGEYKYKVVFKNGQREGRYQSWFPNGQLCEDGRYENDKRFGKWLMWHRNGKLHVEQTIVDVITHSHHQAYVYDGWRHAWFDNSQKEYEEFNVHGKRNGLSQQWCKEGPLLYQTEWLDDQKHGVQKHWHPNGTLKSQSHYQNNMLHGLTQTWYESGQLKSEAMYVSNKKNGPFIQWYESGQLLMTCSYHDDKLDGFQQQLSEDGKVEFAHTWNSADSGHAFDSAVANVFSFVWDRLINN